jgi:hypothetical protein
MNLEGVKDWAREHKIASAAIIILGIITLGLTAGIYQAITSIGMQSQGHMEPHRSTDGAYGTQQDLELAKGGSAATESFNPTSDSAGSGSYVNVQEGGIDITSKDIEKDVSRLKKVTQDHNGYVEESSKREGSLYTSADLTTRVPAKNFSNYMQKIKQDFEVESYNVKNYRLSTQRETTELDILNKTIEDYEKIRKKVKKMENTEKKLDLLMKITDKQLEAKEKMNRYQNDLEDKQKRGNYATVRIDIQEKRKVDITPDNLDNKFKDEVKEMLETVTNTLINTLTGGIEIFFTTIQYLIYLAIMLIPAGAAYRIGKRIYKAKT